MDEQYSTSPDYPALPQPQIPSKNKNRKYIYIVLTVVTVVTVGLLLILNNNKKKPIDTNKSTTMSTPLPVKASDLPASSETKNYENGPLGVTLDYPASWTVTDNTDSGIRIESPDFNYLNLDGDGVSGNFRIFIRKGARPIDSKYIGRGVAIQPSIKVTYQKPAVGQRADTLVTNFGLDTKENFAYFFVAGNFQLSSGDTLGPDYGKETETFIISGGYSSKSLKDDMATNLVPVSYISSSNAYKQGLDVIKSLQLH